MAADFGTRLPTGLFAIFKLSLPRPQVQGSIHDRDMHGASFANLVAELEIENG